MERPGMAEASARRHPAKFSTAIIQRLDQLISELEIKSALDIFAGVGGIHALPIATFGVELELLWAACQQGPVLVGDATRLPIRDGAVDAVITSPVYGNRMSDHHNARDASRRNTYTHVLGQPLHERNAGTLRFPGKAYEELHRSAWSEARRVAARYLIVNCSDFIARGKQVRVCDWHTDVITASGMTHVRTVLVETPRNRFGANAQLRVDHEQIMVFSK